MKPLLKKVDVEQRSAFRFVTSLRKPLRKIKSAVKITNIMIVNCENIKLTYSIFQKVSSGLAAAVENTNTFSC